MKKILIALSMLSMGITSTQAQVAYEKAKPFDNVYLGVEAGAMGPLNLSHFAPLNAAAGVKVGKQFSPVYGANLEGIAFFGDNRWQTGSLGFSNSHTVVRGLNLGLNGTVNFTNLFCEYNPDRRFEVGAEAGIGYWITYGDKHIIQSSNTGDDTELTAKTGLTFAQLGLFVGLNYKFKTSNGTHNFKVWNVGELNDEINSLRDQLNAKPKEVVKEVIKEVIKEVPTTTTQTVRIENMVFVTFEQGKYYLSKQAKAALDGVKAGCHVQIIGTASPEGPKDLNDRLSQNRANIVAKYLEGRGVIVDEALGKGVQGVTSNRLAIVYVK